MGNRSTGVALAAAGITAIFAACGGADGTIVGGETGGLTGGGGTGGGAASGGAGSQTGSGIGYGDEIAAQSGAGASSGAGEGAGGDASCAGETSAADLIPLDLYIMLDASTSMREPLPTGGDKWNAVATALEAFFVDPQSKGLGVGLQFFPLNDPNVPTCTNDAACGEYGPCEIRVCGSKRPVTSCTSNAECGENDRCLYVGQCSVSGRRCLKLNPTTDSPCPEQEGRCELVTESTCAHPACGRGVYATPAVAIAPLDVDKAGELVATVTGKELQGATPTAAALSGALEQAHTHALANPTHRVVTVLVTDGMPTECSPLTADGIAGLAREALDGAPSISTFVIGVFDGNDVGAQATMDRIAEGGGTEKAFFIDTRSNVTQAFLDALSAIRGKSLACEYQVPTPSDGQTLDYGTLNVQHTRTGAADASTVFYVGDEASCDPAAGGWFYDVDPAHGGTPTKIVMCPETCAQFREGGKVELRVGCKTEVPPVPL